jgi:hypothetical protein
MGGNNGNSMRNSNNGTGDPIGNDSGRGDDRKGVIRGKGKRGWAGEDPNTPLANEHLVAELFNRRRDWGSWQRPTRSDSLSTGAEMGRTWAATKVTAEMEMKTVRRWGGGKTKGRKMMTTKTTTATTKMTGAIPL